MLNPISLLHFKYSSMPVRHARWEQLVATTIVMEALVFLLVQMRPAWRRTLTLDATPSETLRRTHAKSVRRIHTFPLTENSTAIPKLGRNTMMPLAQVYSVAERMDFVWAAIPTTKSMDSAETWCRVSAVTASLRGTSNATTATATTTITVSTLARSRRAATAG